MIRIDEFSKIYGSVCAVKGLTAFVKPGEILGLVGPNGAGKTTTLRAVAGIVAPTSGAISVGGHDIVEDPVEAKRILQWVPDTPHPFELLTVEEHLRFTAMAYGVRDAESRFDALLLEFELEEKRKELGSTLSRGMQQKLAICCAFLRDPQAVILDEPLTGLDPRGRKTMRDAIHRRAEEGAAVIVSSHQLDLVERLCNRVLVLHRGSAVAQGTLDDVREISGAGRGASLEEVFFALTEGAGRTDP